MRGGDGRSPGSPERDAWPWLALSATIHVGYVVCLAHAYGAGDFSLAYPLARGGGAMVAAVGGIAFLDDRLSVLGYVAIVVITGGLVSFVRPGTSWDSIRWALLVARADRLLHARRRRRCPAHRGHRLRARHLRRARRSRCRRGDWRPVTSPTCGARWAASWRSHLTSGLASAAAYGLVLYAVRWAPVGYVTALRESSVVLAALAGWRFLAEGFGRARLASATVVRRPASSCSSSRAERGRVGAPALLR